MDDERKFWKSLGAKNPPEWRECLGCGEQVYTTADASNALCDDCLKSNLAITPKEKPEPAYKKGNIPAALRWEVLERDNFTCQKCGSRRFLEADHIVPEALGGKTVLENLQTLCRKCNRAKGVGQ